MSTLVAIVALPMAAAVILVLLRTGLAHVLVKAPAGDRWRMDATPFLGGTGIFVGLLTGVGAAVAVGAIDGDRQLVGILGGCTVLFVAGMWDDLRHLSPLVKLVAQGAATAVVLGTGTGVELIDSPVAGTALAVLWLVGMTNAFNLLDNMDGLAATLAAIAALFFAIDAVTIHPNDMHLALAIALAAACAGFLPFNLRPGRRAAVFMGDSGSQLLGFALAALGLSASWNVAGTTVATLALPILILAVPILDTTLVTIVRLLEGRPVSQGGRDHSSHRLVRFGLSESGAVLLLAVVAVSLGTTSLAYNVLDNQRITLVGVLLTFVALIQFASFLADVEQRPSDARRGIWTAFDVHWRRLIEVVVDFGVIVGSFLAAYLVRFDGVGTPEQRHVFMVTAPVLVAARYLAFIPFGLYRSIWRYAGARDLAGVVAAVALSEIATVLFVSQTQSGSLHGLAPGVFVLDALLCVMLIGGTRLGERLLVPAIAGYRGHDAVRRTVIVGAGRSGRSLHRELRETSGERVLGFVDDNPRLRRRRLQGRPVLGTTSELPVILARTRPDRVLVTIPNAPRERLDSVVAACAEAAVPCAFVRREIEHEPRLAATVASE